MTHLARRGTTVRTLDGITHSASEFATRASGTTPNSVPVPSTPSEPGLVVRLDGEEYNPAAGDLPELAAHAVEALGK